MPRYLSQHTLACLTRQGAETLAQRMQGGGPAHAERVLVNMVDGKMFAEFRSDSRETLEARLKTEGMLCDGSLSHLYYHQTKMTVIHAGRNPIQGRFDFLPVAAAIWARGLWTATFRTLRYRSDGRAAS
jgi:hypothetical protein